MEGGWEPGGGKLREELQVIVIIIIRDVGVCGTRSLRGNQLDFGDLGDGGETV